jgi:hypothetical protein
MDLRASDSGGSKNLRGHGKSEAEELEQPKGLQTRDPLACGSLAAIEQAIST